MSDTDLSFSEEAGHQVKCQLIEMSLGQLTNLKIISNHAKILKLNLQRPLTSHSQDIAEPGLDNQYVSW